MDIRLKRIYDPAEDSDGFRVLVDRLWPRGVSKDRAAIDLWAKDLAPSDELRRWYHQDKGEWDTFQARYLQELASREAAVEQFFDQAPDGMITFVYAAADPDHNHAQVLKSFLEKHLRSR